MGKKEDVDVVGIRAMPIGSAPPQKAPDFKIERLDDKPMLSVNKNVEMKVDKVEAPTVKVEPAAMVTTLDPKIASKTPI